MKKNISIYLFLLVAVCVNAQSYLGYLTDNYSGVHGVISNPANITDSRFKADVNLIGISTALGNNFYGVDVFDVLNHGFDTIEDYDFENKAESYLSENNNIAFNVDVLGPSFMFNINNTNSVALFTRVRAFLNINKINGSIYDLIEDNEDISDLEEGINEDDYYTAAHTWSEIGATYARVLYNENQHFVKGGISLKYLVGIASGYSYGDNINIKVDDENLTTFDSGTTISRVTAEGEALYATYEDFDEDFEIEDVTSNIALSNGVGVDLGFVYEWRPDYKAYTYDSSKKGIPTFKDENKYKVKFGLSITDIGSVKYKEGEEGSYAFNFDSSDFDSLEGFEDADIEDYYTETTNTVDYKISLPTALHVNIDYFFKKNLYVNFNTDLSLVSKSKIAANSISNVVSLTPRYESKWFSFYLPLNVIQYNGFQAGAGLRAGPLYIGSGSIISVLASNKTKGADVYVGLKIPIYQNSFKDKDGDGISDKLDACPKVAGPKANQGCPYEDVDKDGVLGDQDKCPTEFGPKENNGCPWEDKDGDGVLDNVDECPEEAGTKEKKGCPIVDKDEDGVLDTDDKCPDVAGAKENNGCPWGDKDKDGVLDNVDKCPEVKGEIARQGCPAPKYVAPIQQEKLKELQSFAKAIYFNSGKTTFKPGVTGKLDIIASIMQEYPNANFTIEGHTDSQGAAATNLSLSKRRAQAVLNYIVTKGVPSSRLSSVGYGEEFPIADNQTRDGRAQNRRVEIKLRR